MIDERFERLAFQYDEDQIGDLDDEADEGELAGASDIAKFDGILDEFIEKNVRGPFRRPPRCRMPPPPTSGSPAKAALLSNRFLIPPPPPLVLQTIVPLLPSLSLFLLPSPPLPWPN